MNQYGKYLEYKRNKNKNLNQSATFNEIKIDENKLYFGVNLDMDNMEIPREEIRKKINPYKIKIKNW